VNERVYIGLGSNLGCREERLIAALESLRRIDGVAVLRVSSLYESAPVGPPQPRYLNAVTELACDLTPQRLLTILQQIELEQGRERAERWGARTLDLDVLLWEGRIVAEPLLQIPHLGLHRRRFVLEPLAELCPDSEHPILGKSVQAMLADLEPQDVSCLAPPAWPELLHERTL
jgi:2-amino-4-hydroxy-6-hydroxymethyldihydropteridine diphosphokinase